MLADKDGELNWDSFSYDRVLDMMRTGGTRQCPPDLGPSQNVMLSFPPGSQPTLCNVGIFTCTCENIKATREEGKFQPTELIFYESEDNIKQETIIWEPPQLYGRCDFCELWLETKVEPAS